MDDGDTLDPAVQRDLDEVWDALEDDDLEAAAEALASARAAAPDDPAVLEAEAELALA